MMYDPWQYPWPLCRHLFCFIDGSKDHTLCLLFVVYWCSTYFFLFRPIVLSYYPPSKIHSHQSLTERLFHRSSWSHYIPYLVHFYVPFLQSPSSLSCKWLYHQSPYPSGRPIPCLFQSTRVFISSPIRYHYLNDK